MTLCSYFRINTSDEKVRISLSATQTFQTLFVTKVTVVLLVPTMAATAASSAAADRWSSRAGCSWSQAVQSSSPLG